MSSQHNAIRNRRGGALGVLVAGLMLVASTAHASGVPVVDGVHLGISKFAWVEQYRQMYEEFQKQKQQYETQVRQYEQMKLTAAPFKSATGHREDMDTIFPPRGINDGVVTSCGNTQPSGGANVEYRMQQYQLCIRIVQLENRRYNTLREVFTRIRQKDDKIQTLIAERNALAADEFGKLQTINTNIAALETQVQMDLQANHTMLEAYNAHLQGLREENQRIAALVLKGSKGPGGVVGQIASYGTLKLALQAARLRDR